jgi:tetraacyldisaccharide 4'-kinase
VIHNRRKGAAYDALRGLLFGLSQIYSIGLTVYLFAEKIGLRKRVKLDVRVISIGNLTSGGTGKTPVTEMLTRKLQADGFKPTILSRGHGGSLKEGVGQVSNADGHILMSADECGDESALLARRLPGVPVFVGRDRRISAKLAIDTQHPGVILLDDGMQYWQLARDLDIALVDARRPFDNGHVLPRGTLREPKRNLRRAGLLLSRAPISSARQNLRHCKLIWLNQLAHQLFLQASMCLAGCVHSTMQQRRSSRKSRSPFVVLRSLGSFLTCCQMLAW